MRCRKSLAAAAIAAIAALGTSPAAAQIQEGASEGRACFQPRPAPVCRSYWVTEFGATWYNASPKGRTPDERRFSFTWEGGYMRNLSRSNAAGATVFLSGNDQFMRSGVRARVRRWVNRDVAVDLAPSLIVFQANGDVEAISTRPGVSLLGGVSLTRWVGVTTELESTQGGVRLVSGVRLGSYAGSATALALPAMLIVLGDDS
ncbi:MAG TPA: hypothetical protein VFS20_03125 [Longimicrobium sp.]|nr:hypothetical protein [Longimicrobium sp.]